MTAHAPRSPHPNVAVRAALVAAVALAVAAAPGLAPPAVAADDGAGPAATAPDDAARKKDKKRKKDGEGKPGEAGGASKKDEPKEKPFDEVVKDAKLLDGLFKIHRKDEKAWLEIQPDQYDTFFMLSVSRSGGAGMNNLLGNQQLGNLPFQFRKIGKNVQLVVKNVWFRADGDPAMKEAVDRSFSDSLIATAKLESQPHPDRKSDLVDLSSIVFRDAERVEQFTDEQLRSGYKLDKDNSYFGAVKAFPQNVEVEAVLHFGNPRARPFGTLPDSRSMFLRYNWSFSALPEGEFRPRYADDRVGHFVDTIADYSSDAPYTPYRRIVNRWKLEKTDPAAALSPVKEPIVYYLDRSIPVPYRDAVRQGILVWNKAFERVGFKDAIVVKDPPDDPEWDSSDIRYSSVRWFVGTDTAFAIGPSRSNPFTGQIYDADIAFSESMVRGTRREYRELVDPVAQAQAMAADAYDSMIHGLRPEALTAFAPTLFGRPSQTQCGIATEAYRQAAFGRGLLEARGMAPGSPEENAYSNEFLLAVTAHEVGHTLGLQHNFRASTLHPLGELNDRSKTLATGLTGSVMEYCPVNLAPKGARQGEYYQTTLGPYDYWAIEYAYKPIAAASPEDEAPELNRIAARAAEPALAFGNDLDALGFVPAPVGMDPRSHQWDFGSDPIAYFTLRVDLARELWSSLPGSVVRPGEGYQAVRRAFNQGLGEYFPAITSITKYIGGIQNNRDHVGDPGGRAPYVPVAAAEQRRAMSFLGKYLFAPGAFDLKPELLNTIALERFIDPTVGALPPRLDWGAHDGVLALQNLALVRLYHPVLLSRLVDADKRVAKGEDVFTMAEMFAAIRDGIWSELPAASPAGGARPSKTQIDSFRRALQARHLGYISLIAMRGAADAPLEATTLARADLNELKGRIAAALKATGLDPAVKAHLTESASAIERALDASLIRGV